MSGVMKQKGFTLIELLVVIAIIALLLSILIPSLRMAKEHGKRLLCGTNLKTIGQALYMYAMQQDDNLPMNFYQQLAYKNRGSRRTAGNPVASYFLGSYVPAVINGTANERFESLFRGPTATEAEGVLNLGYLIKENMIEDCAKIVYCASNKSNAFSFKAYGGKGDWPRALPGPHAPTTIRVSYSYLPQSRTKKHPNAAFSQFPDAAYKHSDMDPSLSVVLDLLNSPSQLAHKAGSYTGCNILYGDGSVLFRRNSELTANYGIGGSGNLIDGGAANAIKWREILKTLE